VRIICTVFIFIALQVDGAPSEIVPNFICNDIENKSQGTFTWPFVFGATCLFSVHLLPAIPTTPERTVVFIHTDLLGMPVV
jgi:hypothetical protein